MARKIQNVSDLNVISCQWVTVWKISGVLYKKYMHGFSREEEEAFIRQYKKVLIVMSERFYDRS